MARHTSYRKREAERQLPHTVDVPVPPEGFGNRINEMVAWCRDNIQPDGWENHGHSEKRPGEIARDFARFYFANAANADIFRWRLDSRGWRCEAG